MTDDHLVVGGQALGKRRSEMSESRSHVRMYDLVARHAKTARKVSKRARGDVEHTTASARVEIGHYDRSSLEEYARIAESTVAISLVVVKSDIGRGTASCSISITRSSCVILLESATLIVMCVLQSSNSQA
jgi:hypothetical protein